MLFEGSVYMNSRVAHLGCSALWGDIYVTCKPSPSASQFTFHSRYLKAALISGP